MITTLQEYADSLDDPGKAWLIEFFDYMATHYSDIQPIMFRQRPMYKVGKSYIMFTVAQKYFSVHTLNFELIENFKKKYPKAGKGKGCVNIHFTDAAIKPLIQELCDEIVHLNLLPDAPQVDVTPELSYEQKLENAFLRSKAKWRPLYERLRDHAREHLPEFIEFFPAVGILWKHTSTFAQIKCTKNAMQIEFYADKLYADRKPVKHLQTSANRVMHMVEVVDDHDFSRILDWIRESYQLTKKKRKVET